MSRKRIILEKPPRSFALVIIIGCFVISNSMRLSIAGAAMAQQMGENPSASSGLIEGENSADTDVLLEALRERDRQVQNSERRLVERHALMKIAEEEFEKRRIALIEAEERLAATLAIADNAAEKDLQQLTAVYQNMKPKKAAEVFDAMDPAFAAGFLVRMAPESAADILTSMTTETAYSVSVLMASRNMNAPTE